MDAPANAITLRAEAATPGNVAPFGTLLSAEADAPVIRSAFYGDALAMKKPGRFVGDDTLELTVATLQRRPLAVSWMERHFLHTQTFFPLGGRPFLMVLAPPSPEREMPDLSQAKALLFDGTGALMLHLGTWHEFPFALLDGSSVIVAIRRDTVRDLRNVVGNEAQGPDLDKKDIVARAGVEIRVVL
ncbi:MAG: ureidoglycolate lyase [Acetobacteraceae bacterium]|nr:ureidoglycolate lyase [Acetobacteraceae bacterium]MCX7685435.1 ureidoglycolate lyase [Acetobacteraceae bacterium]MDW8398322.1 ureidoglycolate lyase [Acetobacteraceae bacterium]